jgi:hypothetical protein
MSQENVELVRRLLWTFNNDADADKTLGHYEEDHLIPLAVGGSPRSPRNMWPEKYAGKFGARVKDKLERFLHNGEDTPSARGSADGADRCRSGP